MEFDMFKKILVPVKATKGSEKAVHVACNLAFQLDAEVHVITVNVEGFEDKLTGKMMETYVETCKSRGVEATYSMHSVKSIEEVAKTIAFLSADYDLIVMGHCRYKKIYKFLHSSAAEDIIQLASCPVIVAATDCPEKKAFDGLL